MTDIIQDAKKLLDAATRGPWVVYTRSFGVIDAIGPIERDLTEGLDVDSGSAEFAAAAPELAQALAEETYEYGVTYIGVNHGGHHIEWVESTGDAEFDKDSLQLLVKRWKRRGQSPKVVRRRVSPPEVINE